MQTFLDEITDENGRRILSYIKQNGGATITEIVELCNISREAARRRLNDFERSRWLEKASRRDYLGPGRPEAHFRLTRTGDSLFPHHYDGLASGLIATTISLQGYDGLRKLLQKMSEQQIAKYQPLVVGLPLSERLPILANLYSEKDQYMSVGQDERGYFLTEQNCPYLNVALEHPQMCSLTLHSLKHLSEHQVYREKTFQNGDGCCIFRFGKKIKKGAHKEFEFEFKPK